MVLHVLHLSLTNFYIKHNLEINEIKDSCSYFYKYDKSL
jgi:hypothetical protein